MACNNNKILLSNPDIEMSISDLDMSSWNILYESIKGDLKTKSNVLVAYVHWALTRNEFKCLNTEEPQPPQSEEQQASSAGMTLTESQKLPPSWNISGIYAIHYTKFQEVFLLNAMELGNQLIIQFAGLKQFNKSTLKLNLAEVQSFEGPIIIMLPNYRALMSKIIDMCRFPIDGSFQERRLPMGRLACIRANLGQRNHRQRQMDALHLQIGTIVDHLRSVISSRVSRARTSRFPRRFNPLPGTPRTRFDTPPSRSPSTIVIEHLNSCLLNSGNLPPPPNLFNEDNEDVVSHGPWIPSPSSSGPFLGSALSQNTSSSGPSLPSGISRCSLEPISVLSRGPSSSSPEPPIVQGPFGGQSRPFNTSGFRPFSNQSTPLYSNDQDLCNNFSNINLINGHLPSPLGSLDGSGPSRSEPDPPRDSSDSGFSSMVFWGPGLPKPEPRL